METTFLNKLYVGFFFQLVNSNELYNYFVFYAASLLIPAGRTLPSFTTAELVCSLFKIYFKRCAPLLVNDSRRLGINVIPNAPVEQKRCGNRWETGIASVTLILQKLRSYKMDTFLPTLSIFHSRCQRLPRLSLQDHKIFEVTLYGVLIHCIMLYTQWILNR